MQWVSDTINTTSDNNINSWDINPDSCTITIPYLNHHISCSSQSDPQHEFNIITLHAAKMKHVIWMSLWNRRERRWNMFCQCSDKYKSILLAADTTIPTLSNNSQIYKQSVMLVIDTRSQTVYSLLWCYSEKLTATILSAMTWLLKVVKTLIFFQRFAKWAGYMLPREEPTNEQTLSVSLGWNGQVIKTLLNTQINYLKAIRVTCKAPN